MKSPISHAQLDWNDSGTPVSEHFDDVYFSNVNGLEESRYVFLQQNQLPNRWLDFGHRRFVIAETGFGTGLNFLAAWQQFDQFRQQNPNAAVSELHFISFEKYPVSLKDLRKAHQAWPELKPYAEQLQAHYPIAMPDCHRLVLDQGRITLDLWFGDIHDSIPQMPRPETGLVDAWFLDGFAPSKNPDMWNPRLFSAMAQLAKADATCATFTAAGFVRRGLIEAGFEMKKVKGFGTKREMLAGHLKQRLDGGNRDPWLPANPATSSESIAIIGGGIASAMLAQALLRRKQRVTLYCQHPKVAQGASGNQQGAVYPLLNQEHNNIARFFSSAFLYAKQQYQQLSDSVNFAHQWCGVTQLMWNDKASKKLSPVAELGFPLEMVTAHNAEQTRQVSGIELSCASLHYPLGGWLSPKELTRGLIEECVAQGLVVYYNCEVTELEAADKGWQLTTCTRREGRDDMENRVHHDTVIIANGHQFDHFKPSHDLPLGKVKGQVSHIPTTPALAQLQNVLCYDGYLTPAHPATNQHCIGASYDRHRLDTDFDPIAQAQNRQRLIDCLPEQDWPNEVDSQGNQSRQAIRCVSRDHLPFVGHISEREQAEQAFTAQCDRLPYHDNLFALLGLGSRGISSAPLLAELLASQICGDPLPLPKAVLEALHPSRMWIRKLRKGKAITVKPSKT
ncbi:MULTISPECIES: bifunctional tRNA (5-methylaminomethyl-2-thiouridine)(34)-methyltransferase MnmD/FAD-dependent 5-carboxymethylaminomethyl-2-thiouridine(34) oxidoreductase MnmC [unclassified Vibrio]|uniref:tRNA 5-methylaminomethyl-2-thiouridine biosynthesis bifunctional protein MnmC n=1 Tax=Vibrio sp. HB236076 TaxID=3232307 RepID=A0AB39HIB6_9VIBR|nr:bifunctional tRNA (5-methylaminomethyl-2-thiouridine)(34)-methyltransferase MnmD/FAD-dependent 5-carboxymethylaminomethyl-2-thiouridine(34) oxidoreductase MnmC [Vibrio sp. HB161653]MDP5254750.1 bifunctional tRNA (5-methylaminomethyl-2-thiouridine)(34)-methyltransferase MnmD/FAD-dependent 5-carboxymethylaminomethyl-2-thiouridine(34) oxidoreductase MnmC [Vibrio sp. HB161653]